ncbi:MAG: amidohydrolase family protein [Candidatus Aminicenantes bacterium]|nr:amidohydrolase family protein [Candidatus Aminicenantes bacterium]
MVQPLRSGFTKTDVIDIHVHIGGPPGENERLYYWSDKFEQSISFEGMKLVTRLKGSQMTGVRYIGVLFDQLRHSNFVDKLVLLALDQVYSEEGRPLKKATHLFVDNEYLVHLTQIYPGFLFGCSVHPYAPDALERLWHCVNNGAVLCKWLPSAQGIDPTHPRSVEFYRALGDLGLPLLIHVGPEATIPTEMNHEEERLVNAAAGRFDAAVGAAVSRALDEGAKVILAHSGTPLGQLIDPDNAYWEKAFGSILRLLQERNAASNLFADVSAFCLPGRFKYAKEIISLAKNLPGKFLYGSDFPIPVVSLSEYKALEDILRAFGWLAGRALSGNDLDKNFQLLKPHFPEQTFHAANEVLRNPQSPVPDLKKFLRRQGRKQRRFFWKESKRRL